MAKETGTVKWFNNKKGYGFISRDGGEDVFFHESDWCVEGQNPAQGMRVEFKVEQRPRGPAAFYVRHEGAAEEEEALKERAQELAARKAKLEREIRQAYRSFRHRVREMVLGLQEPVRVPSREECPECGTVVKSHPAGMGRRYACPECEWEYFKRVTTRLEQTHHPASPDGRRPAGYSERLAQEDISKGIPPIEIPAQENAAAKLSGNRWESAFPGLKVGGYLKSPPKDVWGLDRWIAEAQQMVVGLESFPPPPDEIPEGLSPDELLEWASAFPEKK